MDSGKPAYLLVTARVGDRGAMAAYSKALAESGLYPRHGGRYLFLGPAAVPLEDWTGESVVCAVFPSRAAAEAFWWDAQYQDEVKPLRAGAGEFHVAIFEGL
jgi:uncharacterized protein (DUF1330 family)